MKSCYGPTGRRFFVENSLVESGGPAGPEFDAIGDQAIPKPVVWTSDWLVGEFLLEYLKNRLPTVFVTFCFKTDSISF